MFANNRLTTKGCILRYITLSLILALSAVPASAIAAKPLQEDASSASLIERVAEPSGLTAESLLLADLLLPDGTLDLSQGRAGSVDLTGYRLVSSLEEAPRFAPESLSNPGDENWAVGFHVPGPEGQVRALAIDSSGNLYAGGSFKTAGGVVVNYVAKWDGTAWSALGTGMSTNVLALAVYGSTLYAGGQFVFAGGVQVNKIAKWDGTAWSPLGQGLNNDVHALVVDTSGNLYAGGKFSGAVAGPAVNHVAKWDSTSWSALGTGVGGVSQYVNTLALDGSTLYAGGGFTFTGSNYIAQWNGTAWSAVGSGTNGEVYALAVGSGGVLYAGGSFTTAGGAPASYIAQWNGAAWSAVGTGMDASVRALAVDGTTLYAGGSFTTAGGTAASYMAQWSGGAWYALGTGLNQAPWALAVGGGGGGGRLYAGGDFTVAGGIAACRVASWQSSAWSPVGVQGNGVGYEVKALATDASGNLYAAGRFVTAGSTAANRVAKWNGTAWSALGTGIANDVWALAVDGSGNVYAGGNFVSPGSFIAKWNGSGWSPLGSGVNNAVRALAISGNTLYVGGDFTTAGGASASRIAAWNLTAGTWSPLVSGIHNGVTNTVRALAADSSGNLYVGGDFTDAGGDANADRIAKWNGSSWLALGTGIPNLVYALAFGPDGSLYAGGLFIQAGGVSANRIAKWNGTTWSALGLGLGGSGTSVNAIAVDSSGAVYAGGTFTSAGGSGSIPYLARWNGTAWSGLGTGVSSFPDALLVDGGGALWVGTAYRLTSPITHYIGRWTAAQGQTISGSGPYTFYANDLPVTIQVTTQGTLARIVMQRFDQSHPNALPGEQTGYYWQIEGLDASGGPASGFTVDMTLTHSVSPPEKSRVCRYTGSNWDCAASSYTASTVTRTGLTQLSDWAVGDASSPLAVNLADFSAEAQANRVLVTWETTSELNNAGFNLYRSPAADGRRELLAFIPSQAPGSTQGYAYSYEDTAAQSGQTLWYWLEDMDVNGATTLHGPVSATIAVPTAVTLGQLSVGAAPPSSLIPAVAALIAAALASTGLLDRKRGGGS